MSTRATLLGYIRDNLDDLDSSNYRWSDDRLAAIMDRARRKVYEALRSLKPGRYYRSSETINLVASTSEYDLSGVDIQEIVKVERIAFAGAVLDKPQEVIPVLFQTRLQYTYNNLLGNAGADYYYIVPKSGLVWTIGILPIPAQAGTADIKVYYTLGPAGSWLPGSARDTVESGLPPRWEDLIVLESTVDALTQRPPRDATTLQQWGSQRSKQFEVLKDSEGMLMVDKPQSVTYDDDEAWW